MAIYQVTKVSKSSFWYSEKQSDSIVGLVFSTTNESIIEPLTEGTRKYLQSSERNENWLFINHITPLNCKNQLPAPHDMCINTVQVKLLFK